MRSIVKIDSKGRVTIPQHIREPLGIGLGTYFEIIVDSEKKQIVLKPLFKGGGEGIAVEVIIKLKEIKDLQEVITICSEGGYEIISLNCLYGEVYECALTIYAIDEVQISRLKELLSKYEITMRF
ncbi:MAG: AbrB/MazE/SpoVT family DNA-binding domain-containing protein [Sulfolobales archaeon]